MKQYHVFVIKSVVKLGEEECKKYDLHEKYLEDCRRQSFMKSALMEREAYSNIKWLL